LLARLPKADHELVVFDVNRMEAVRGLIARGPLEDLETIRNATNLPFASRLVANSGPASRTVATYTREAGASEVAKTELPLEWPSGVFSLGHVSLPFPSDDPRVTPLAAAGFNLGALALRGESGALVLRSVRSRGYAAIRFFDVVRAKIAETLPRATKQRAERTRLERVAAEEFPGHRGRVRPPRAPTGCTSPSTRIRRTSGPRLAALVAHRRQGARRVLRRHDVGLAAVVLRPAASAVRHALDHFGAGGLGVVRRSVCGPSPCREHAARARRHCPGQTLAGHRRNRGDPRAQLEAEQRRLQGRRRARGTRRGPLSTDALTRAARRGRGASDPRRTARAPCGRARGVDATAVAWNSSAATRSSGLRSARCFVALYSVSAIFAPYDVEERLLCSRENAPSGSTSAPLSPRRASAAED